MHPWKIALILSLTFAVVGAQEPERVKLKARDEEKIVTRSNLKRMKRFILSRGETGEYSDQYSHNPSVSTKHFIFYLNPDGKNNRDCVKGRSDFNTLIIRAFPGVPGKPDEVGQYLSVDFVNELEIWIEVYQLNPGVPVSRIRELAEMAIAELSEKMRMVGYQE